MPDAPKSDNSRPATTPSEPPSEADLISASLVESRELNARFMNGIRFFAILAFNVIYFVFREFVDVDEDAGQDWETQFHLLIYLTGSGVLWLLSYFSGAVRNLSRFAVPFFDMPMTTCCMSSGSMP